MYIQNVLSSAGRDSNSRNKKRLRNHCLHMTLHSIQLYCVNFEKFSKVQSAFVFRPTTFTLTVAKK